MAKNQSCLQRCPAEELSGAQIVLSPSEYGVLQRLRDFSFVNGGIPDNELFLKELTKKFGVSAYKFKKFWPILEQFFEKTFEKIFVYPEDEEKRTQARVLTAKRQIAGKKGAELRWGKPLDGCSESTPLVMALAIETDSKPIAKHLEPDVLSGVGRGLGSSSVINTEEKGKPTANHPLPPPSQTGPQMAPQPVLLSDDHYRAICGRAHELGMSKPSHHLAVRVLRKFPGLRIDEILKHLIRWDGQTSCGLWDTKTFQDFVDEALRQTEPHQLNRKPTEREKLWQRVLDLQKSSGD